MTHKSYDKLTHEHHKDDFNIDFLRYFKLENLIGNFVGSIIGIIFFFFFNLDDTFFASNDFTSNLYIIGIVAVFICFTGIAKIAGNSIRHSAKIAGKRGLYSFVFLSLFLIIAILISGEITLTDTFERFLYFLMAGQIATAAFAVPLDLLATLKS